MAIRPTPGRSLVTRRAVADIVRTATLGSYGVTGFAGGRPKVEEIVAYWPALVDKSVVRTQVEILS